MIPLVLRGSMTFLINNNNNKVTFNYSWGIPQPLWTLVNDPEALRVQRRDPVAVALQRNLGPGPAPRPTSETSKVWLYM